MMALFISVLLLTLFNPAWGITALALTALYFYSPGVLVAGLALVGLAAYFQAK